MSLRWGILSTARINDRFIVGCAGRQMLGEERKPRLGRTDAIGQAATVEALYASAAAQGAHVQSDG